jgi:predicted ester cyclase
MGIPATNNQVTWSELHAYRVDGDRITEIWTEADFLGIMAQIGAVKMPA